MPENWTRNDLISWRTRMGFTQRTAAEELNTPFATYLNWEQGRRRLPGVVVLTCMLLEEQRDTLTGDNP